MVRQALTLYRRGLFSLFLVVPFFVSSPRNRSRSELG